MTPNIQRNPISQVNLLKKSMTKLNQILSMLLRRQKRRQRAN